MELQFGDYRLRLHERQLVGPEGPIEINGRSFDLLRTLLERPMELVSKAELFDSVWPGVVVEENTLQVHMSGLRKLVGQGFIVTVHGRGYKYAGPAPQMTEDAPTAPPQARRGNMHRYRQDCVARESEAAALTELLAAHRLVTIVGPGGVGKTTLAASLVAETADASGAAGWMIDLASVSSAEYVESAVIQALGIPFRAGSRALETIVNHLRPTSDVLLIDNCEHVRGAAAQLVRDLLFEAPNVRILATSQVPLGLPDERVFKLMPFGVATPGGGDELAQSARFLAHCYAGFGETIAPEEMQFVLRLCKRLDGMALALKMAAARAATLGLEAVDQQLEVQLADLSADWDPTLERHRSLQASLSWSYDLLSPRDQRTLRCLSVFRGSFSFEGVTAVAGSGSDPSIAELVRRSLVVREDTDRSRYRLLDSTRQFALDKLIGAGEEQAARDRHLSFVVALFSASIDKWEEMPDERWDQTYRPDGDNLRAALDWAKQQQAWPAYVDLAGSAYRYFIEEQLGSEGLATIEAGLPALNEVSVEAAARLRLALGEICRFNAMDIRAKEALIPALGYFRGSNDGMRLCQTLVLLAWITIFFGTKQEARPYVDELIEAIARQPSSKVKAWALVAIGVDMWREVDGPAGLARCEAGLAMHVAMGNPKGRFRSVMNLSEMLHNAGDTVRSIALVMSILPELRRSGPSLQLGFHLSNLASYNLALGHPELAREPLYEAAKIVPRDGSNWHWCLLQNAAELFRTEGEHHNAALLLGFADKGFESWPDGRQDTEQAQRDRLFRELSEVLSKPELERFMAQGRTLSMFEADHIAGFHGT